MLIFILLFLFVVSFAIALRSLMHELKKPPEVEHAEKELSKEKILFHA